MLVLLVLYVYMEFVYAVSGRKYLQSQPSILGLHIVVLLLIYGVNTMMNGLSLNYSWEILPGYVFAETNAVERGNRGGGLRGLGVRGGLGGGRGRGRSLFPCWRG